MSTRYRKSRNNFERNQFLYHGKPYKTTKRMKKIQKGEITIVDGNPKNVKVRKNHEVMK